jgi:hypothetical protein
VQIIGHRTAPSWIGEYGRFDLNRGAALRLVEGVGMPFTSFIEGFQVESRKGGCTLTLRVEYEVSGIVRMNRADDGAQPHAADDREVAAKRRAALRVRV